MLLCSFTKKKTDRTTGGPNSRCEGRVKCNLHNIGDASVSRYRRPLKIYETLYEKYITEICAR